MTPQNTNPAGNPKIGGIPAALNTGPTTPAKPEEFQNFETLTRKLTQVSKSDPGKKRQKA